MKSAKEFFEAVSEKSGIPCRRSFWDSARHGNKPDTYFVWRTNGAEAVINSDDTTETEKQMFAVSIFTKSDDLESVCDKVELAAEAEEALSRRLHFEDYEKDTGYYHGEITITRYSD